MALVTVQIVTFNNRSTIKRCIESVLAQRHVPFDIWVLDNNSQDETPELVLKLKVPIIQSASNSGYAAGHNRLLQCTASPFILTLNPDAWLEPDFLLHMMRAVTRRERIGSAAGCLLRVESPNTPPTGVDSAGLFIRRNRRQGLHAEGVPVDKRPTQPAPIFGPDGAAAFYRRAMLNDIQIDGEVFDCDFFIEKEDVDVAWRARLRGWESVYVPDAIGYHIRTFRPGKRKGVSPIRRAHAVRNRYSLMLKNDDLTEMRRDVLHILVYEMGVMAYLLLFERESLRVLLGAWRFWHRLVSKRRYIRARRTVQPKELRRWFHGH
jgi:GT2 family glycosyltransferase